MDQPLLTVARAARIIGVAPQKIRTLVEQGLLPVAARGGRGDRRFLFEDVRRAALLIMAERRAGQRADEE